MQEKTGMVWYAEYHRWEGLGERVQTGARGGLLPQTAKDMSRERRLQKPHQKGG